MQQKKLLCLLIGNSPHHLDHLAPLSIELNLPLFVIEEKIYELAKKYYPQVNVIHTNFFHLITHHIKKFDGIISCFPIKVLKTAFSLTKDLEYYWLPHGHSDKGKTQENYFKLLAEEDHLLLYGQNLIEEIKKSGGLQKTNYFLIKNFRYFHYLKNKEFYHSKVESLGIKKDKPVLLYAPTWNDAETSSSFCNFSSHLKKLEKQYHVICKWHPNLLIQEPTKIKQLEEKHPQIYFLHEFTPIYPILSITDIYIGDVSSIGYDFLTFQKPMIFLSEHKRKLRLFSCGKTLIKKDYDKIENILNLSLLTHTKTYAIRQKKLYEHTFGKIEPIDNFNNYFQDLKERLLVKSL